MSRYDPIHQVLSPKGEQYARWADRVTYKPGTTFAIVDRSICLDALKVNDPAAWDTAIFLEVQSWREDSTLDWGPAARQEWVDAIAAKYVTSEAARLSELRPAEDYLLQQSRLGRRMIPIALKKRLSPLHETFGDFMGELRAILTELELHEMNEWIRVDEGALPFDPHRPVARDPLEWFVAREQVATYARLKNADPAFQALRAAYDPQRIEEWLKGSTIDIELSDAQKRFAQAALDGKEISLQHTRKGPVWTSGDPIADLEEAAKDVESTEAG